MLKLRVFFAVIGMVSLNGLCALGSSASDHGTEPGFSFQIVTTPNGNQPYPKQNYLTSVSASSATDVWAVGASAIHYDGTAWKAFAAPDMTGSGYNLLTGVADVAANNVWAVGYINLQRIGAYQSAIVEHFDGTSWSIVSSPQFAAPATAALYSIAAIAANDIWAAGELYEDPYAFPLLEHYDGTSWTQTAPPVSDCIVEGLSADATNDVWAVGTELGGTTCTLHYDGSVWTFVTSANQCCGYNELTGVVALAPDNVWASGWYVQSATDDRPELTLVEHYDGTAWSVVSSPNFGKSGEYSSRLNAIFASSANSLWAVGQSINISSDEGYTLALHWNGREWSIVPTPDIAVHGFYADDLDGGLAAGNGDLWLVGSNDVAYTLVIEGAP